MTRLWRWLMRRPTGGDAAEARRQAEAELEATRRQTAVVEQRARQFARQPADRFLDRVTKAFGDHG